DGRLDRQDVLRVGVQHDQRRDRQGQREQDGQHGLRHDSTWGLHGSRLRGRSTRMTRETVARTDVTSAAGMGLRGVVDVVVTSGMALAKRVKLASTEVSLTSCGIVRARMITLTWSL